MEKTNITKDKAKDRNKREREREQQACRYYWVRVYGSAAERQSRGGVTWF